ncbi:MAG: histidinol-phosphate transaminase [Pseudomonadota bacterium]
MSDITQIAVPGVLGLKPYQPGKPVEELEREYGISGAIKLASNENPFGPSPLAVDAIRNAVTGINYYPDGYQLIAKLATRMQCNPACITLGNGSNDVLDMIARAFLMPETNAVFSEKAFAVYPISTQAVGAQLNVARALPADHVSAPYGHDLNAMSDAVNSKTRVVFIANPNNPTGTWLAMDDVKAFVLALPKTVIAVLDLAYIEYIESAAVNEAVDWLKKCPNLIITRTFSKIFGLAGARIGYSISSPEIADFLNRVRHPFNANVMAIAGAIAALDDDEFIQKSIRANADGLRAWENACDEVGLTFIPSKGNFVTIDFARDASEVYAQLLRQGVIVRPLANYGMPNHLRVTIGTASDNERAIAALKQVVA